MIWPRKKIGELVTFKKGKKMDSSANKAEGAEPYIGIENLRTNTYLLYTQDKNGVPCKPDDVLLVWDGAYAGTVGIGLRGFVGSTIVKVHHNNSLNNRFLVYLLNYNQVKIRSAAQGAAVPHLNKTFVNNLKIPLPSLEIQRQVIERLDAIRKAQELNDKQISLADELFQSLLNRELDLKGTDRKMNKLEEVTEIIMGQSPPSSTYNTKRNGLPFLQGKFEFGEIYPIPIKFCSQPLRIAKKNDVLLSVRAPVGPVNLAPSECCIGRGLSAIRAKAEKLDQLFLFYFMKLNEERMSLLGCGSTFNAIGRDHIEKIKISLPPLQTQRQIVAKLQAVQDYKKKLLEQKQKLQELFLSCLDKAMKGKFVK